MCLIIDTSIHPDAKPIQAKKDIKCYKVVIFRGQTEFYPTGMYTPFQEVLITLTYLDGRDNIFTPHRFQQYPIPDVISNLPTIAHGIHVCANKHQANTIIAKDYHFFPSESYCIIPVKIPKGAYYWIGTNDDLCAEYIQFPDNWKDYLK